MVCNSDLNGGDFAGVLFNMFTKQWAGLYAKADRYLYVNRGFGVLGYPGRVGILPEITVFTLQHVPASE